MARISTYAVSSPAALTDELIGSDINKATKNFTVGSILDLTGVPVGTENTLSMFGPGTTLIDSLVSQDNIGIVYIGTQASGTRFTNTSISSPNLLGTDLYVANIYGNNGGLLNIQGNAIIGNEATDTLTVNGVSTFNADVTVGGKVGVNTTTPLANLDVKETTTDVAGQIIVGGLIDADDIAFGKLCFANTASANSQPNKILASIEGRKNGSSNRGILTFGMADGSGSNWEKMRIDSYGKVAIGTTDPVDKLHVQGTVRAVVPGSSGIAFNAINGFGVSSAFRFDNNHAVLALRNNSTVIATKISSDGFSWFNGGGVGFGTTTPASPVEMVIPDTSSTTRGGLLLSEVGDSSTLDSVRVEYESRKNLSGNPGLIFTPRSQPSSGVWETFFRFKTNGGELVGNKANLTVDGKVGIGTTNDNFASRLTVAKGDIEVTEYEKGLILRSINGTRYRLVVANDGTLTTTAV